jgi:hypothetical protein
MGIVVRITDNSAAFLERTRAQVAAGVEAAAEVLAKSMKDTLATRGTSGNGYHSGRGGALPSSPGSPPAYQRGELHRSIRSTRAQVVGNRISAAAGTNLFYGATLERGFTATARGGGLTIPVQREAYNLLQRYGSARNIPGLVKIKKADGRLLLCLKGPNGSLKPMFLLQKRVVVAPRPWLRPSLDRARIAMAVAFNRAASSTGRAAA